METSLDAIKEIVGGWYELVSLPMTKGVMICCDDLGVLAKANRNFYLAGRLILGTVFFCCIRDDEFLSITPGAKRTVEQILAIGAI
jgi:hypothetical protein